MHETISLRVIDLSFGYNSETILNNENISLEGHGIYTILGPNGSGKTTFFKILLGLLKPSNGSVLVNGEDVTGAPLKAGNHMSYVPQLSNIFYTYPMTGREIVEMGVKSRYKCSRTRCKELADKYIGLVGAEEFADKKLNSLSGGQLQRILIARALARETPILLLDEPFSGIDPKGRDSILNIIRKLGVEKMILITTHDPVLTVNLSKRIIVFNRGIKAVGSPEDVFRLELLRRAYGENILMIERCLHVLQ